MKSFILLSAAVLGMGISASDSFAQAEKAEKVIAAVEKPASEGVLSDIHKLEEHLVTSFNAGKPDEVASLFVDEGEWIDEQGNHYHGQKQIQDVLTKYFETYPGAEISLEIEGVRVLGPLAIEEGIRTMSAGMDSRALISYVAVLTKTESGWKLASVKDTETETIPTAPAALAPLSWLVGEWVNEGDDGRVHVTYRWDEHRNFLLGEYIVTSEGDEVMRSTTRVGFDPITGKIRSWLFDSDGGFGEGSWTQLGESWHIHSVAVLPDGVTGSATITLTPQGNDRFTLRGTNRLVGGSQEEDFELSVVRKAPAAESVK